MSEQIETDFSTSPIQNKTDMAYGLELQTSLKTNGAPLAFRNSKMVTSEEDMDRDTVASVVLHHHKLRDNFFNPRPRHDCCF